MEKILIIIPAYNEEKSILKTYNEIINYNKKHKTNTKTKRNIPTKRKTTKIPKPKIHLRHNILVHKPKIHLQRIRRNIQQNQRNINRIQQWTTKWIWRKIPNIWIPKPTSTKRLKQTKRNRIPIPIQIY